MEGDVQQKQAVDNWKHRSKGMLCFTCMYFVWKESTIKIYPEGMGIGRCRRHAPTMNGWPVMREGDWCGDHKLDENRG